MILTDILSSNKSAYHLISGAFLLRTTVWLRPPIQQHLQTFQKNCRVLKEALVL